MAVIMDANLPRRSERRVTGEESNRERDRRDQLEKPNLGRLCRRPIRHRRHGPAHTRPDRADGERPDAEVSGQDHALHLASGTKSLEELAEIDQSDEYDAERQAAR